MHERTDGCARQYKSKHSFGIISTSNDNLNVNHIANYIASGHGKGEVDQAAGFVKTAAKHAVISNPDVVIRNAEELYHFTKSYLTTHEINLTAKLSERRFFSMLDVDDVRREPNNNYKTIKRNAQPVFGCINRV